MTTNEVRESYLTFFEGLRHRRVPSAPLVPENDPTTLFTSSGMQPMLPYLLGARHPLGVRITDAQKSFRVSDIDEVGDNRHTTFFEMLGNWSLGDYFKAEQIPWIFTWLTEQVRLDPARLYVTVFRGDTTYNIPRDQESAQIWQDVFAHASLTAQISDQPEAIDSGNFRIFYYGVDKNWWSRSGPPDNMPPGEPGGPDSEMFWDFGKHLGLHERSRWRDRPCHLNCDCGRFMEIGNSVFMQYVRAQHGFHDLPQRNVDFGGGLERVMAAHNDNPDIYSLDVFAPMRERLERLAGKAYLDSPETTRAFRVIMDHLRAAAHLLGDGVQPAAHDQGYVVRRLIRRAIGYADRAGIAAAFCAPVVQASVAAYEDAYPALRAKLADILAVVSTEEEKFRRTLADGLRRFEASVQDQTTGQLSGQTVFDLYQSYGFPLEMSRELAAERGLLVDEAAFAKELDKHRAASRAGAEHKFKGGLADHSPQSIRYHTATHLLHQALRSVLGSHAVQRGSNITPARLRFDFAFPRKVKREELAQVEALVNAKIKADLPVSRAEMSVAEARAQGALGLFAAKYGDRVSVYHIGDFSVEICGGPHVARTGELGRFKFIKEEAAGSGVRRVKAILE